MTQEWPYCLRPTPEEIEKDEEFLRRYENGEIEFKPIAPGSRHYDRMKRLQAQPWTVSIIMGKEDLFTIEMRCDCGAEESFNQTVTRPYRDHRDTFVDAHRGCPKKNRVDLAALDACVKEARDNDTHFKHYPPSADTLNKRLD